MTGIEITDTHVKLMQARPQGGSVVLGAVRSRPIDQPNDEHITALVKQLAAGLKQEPVFVVIPRRFVILKQVRLPSHSSHEIRRMAALQLASHAPYAIEDVIFDYQVLAKEPSGYTRVLLGIVHKDVAERYLGIAARAQLQCARLVLSSSGIAEWFNWYDRTARVGSGACVLINIEDSSSEICFWNDHKLVSSRSIQYGAKDLTEGGLSGVMEQIGFTLGTYKKEQAGPRVSKIFIISSRPVATLQERLKEFYSIPVEAINPAEKLADIKGLQAVSDARQDGLAVAVLLGLHLGGIQKQMNFMPPHIQTHATNRQNQLALLNFGLAALISVVLMAGAFQIGNSADKQYLAQLEKTLQETRPDVEKAKDRIRLLEYFRNELTDRLIVADLMKELYRLAPESMTFQTIYLDPQGNLTLLGSAPASITVNNFQQSLINSIMFRDATLEYATKRRSMDKEFTDFKIICKLSSKGERS